MIRIYIEPLSTGARGSRSRVHLGSLTGPVLVEATRQPLLDGARALLARGITGDFELWANESYPRLRGRIEHLSKLAVKENKRVSPSFVAYEPFAATGSRLQRAKRKRRQVTHPEMNAAVSPVTGNSSG